MTSPATFSCDHGRVEVSTFIEVLRQRAISTPERKIFTFLGNGEDETETLTLAELDRQAQHIAIWLDSRCRPGDRALLLYPSGLSFISAFFGCLYAGVLAVPLFPPHSQRHRNRVRTIIADARPKLALTTSTLQGKLTRNDALGIECLSPDAHSQTATAESWRPPEIDGDAVAFLQYTSGSTGDPKGVRVTHRNLIVNCLDVRPLFEPEDSVAVSWLPSFHDMGLIGGVLYPVFWNRPCYMMAASAFLQRPERWLRAIDRYRGTYSAAPDFAYALCVRRIPPEKRADLDLSSWRLAMNGAEPVRRETLDSFVEAFAPCGFDPRSFGPGYGLAEATLKVTSTPPQSAPRFLCLDSQRLRQGEIMPARDEARSTTVVGCGRVDDSEIDTEVVIVDAESHRPCDDRQVGEIWVKGSTVADGYWRRPQATEETFRAYARDGLGPFLRTGDLGFVDQGELFVVGRAKDLIVYHGQNHHPQDIEATVYASHPALRPGGAAAFAIDDGARERLVIVAELTRQALPSAQEEPGTTLDSLRSAVFEAVSEAHELPLAALVLVPPGGVLKTSSGKIRRRATRDAFVDERLQVVAVWQTEDRPAPMTKTPELSGQEIEGRLAAALAERLGIDATLIERDRPFARFGLDSVAMVELAATIGETFETPLPPTALYDSPTISALARHLRGEVTPQPSAIAANDEPLAVVGLGCRFPGAEGDAFWQLLREGRDAVRSPPASRMARWPVAWRGSSLPAGGYLDDIDGFDAAFFDIAPLEAAHMDPQQRLLLETTYQALEDGGWTAAELAGRQVGVFVGLSAHDYEHLGGDPHAYRGTGAAASIAANRISYHFDFRGPSVVVDTACSSSLTALHWACRSLRGGDCEVALVAGVNLLLDPRITEGFALAGMMSASGRCRTFSADADGYVRGEGCGVVILRPLAAAQREEQRFYALVRGTAVNQDGRSNGLTAPNGPAQQEVIRRALADAGIEARQIGYVEAHGTGTPLGDPLELNALCKVLGDGRDDDETCFVGSVKTNLGHLEAAAGIAGLIKAVLALHHQQLPAHLHLDRLHPSLPRDPRFVIPRQLTSWPHGERRRYAGVSSFGFGGTNAHAILEEAPLAAAFSAATIDPAGAADRPLHLLAVAAASRPALTILANSYREHLQSFPETSSSDFCWSVNRARADGRQRRAVIAASLAELDRRLAGIVRQPGDDIRKPPPRVAFLLTGQGAQFVGMGRELYDTQPLFRDSFDQCAAWAEPRLPEPLTDVVFGRRLDEANARALLERTLYAQPALFALQIALARLWQSWGVRPTAVLGHSVGEIAAACIAGVMTPRQGMELVLARARGMDALPAGGAMAAVAADEHLLAPFLDDEQRVLAAVNGPRQSVISGTAAAVEDLCARLTAEGVRVTPLAVSHAFHSPLIEPALDALRAAVSGQTLQRPKLPLITNLSGEEAGDEITTAEYWCQQARRPVRFGDGMKTLWRHGIGAFVEIGPQPVLLGMGRQAREGGEALWLPSLRRQRGDWQQLLDSLARLWESGVDIDWTSFDTPYQRQRLPLPTYAFERRSYWLEDSPADGSSAAEDADFLKRWRRLPASQRRAALETHLRALLVPLLKLDDADQLDPHQGFFDLGMDSLLLVTLRDRLERQLAIEIPATLPIDHPNLGSLTDYFFARLNDEASNTAEVATAPANQPTSHEDADRHSDLAVLDVDAMAELLAHEVAAAREALTR